LSILDEEFLKLAPFFGGEEALTVVKTLMKLKEATDESIANESGIRLNTIRKILYKLYDHALVSAKRVQDEKTGWYIFYWKLQSDQLDAFIRNRKRRTLEKLKARYDFELAHEFFVCPKCQNVRVTFEDAMESTFRCIQCGEQLKSVNNEKIVQFLAARIKLIEAELDE
jgi:transcription initiation factor TFIIE subunit alpha